MTADARAALVPAAIMVAATAAFVLARVLIAGDGDISNFVVAGDRFVDPTATGLPVQLDRGGYDGQFFYRLARDPLDHATSAYGVVVDSPLRAARIAYPFLVWVVALGGSAALVPWSLVLVNVAGLGALGFVGGLFARQAGRSALWGLLISGWAGFVFTLARDLGEIVAACGLAAGLLAVRRGAVGPAVAAFSIALLARETTLIVVAALAAVLLLQRIRAGAPGHAPAPATMHVTWIVPAAVFMAWQLVCLRTTGELPILVSLEGHAVDPDVGSRPGDGEGAWLGLSLRLAMLKLAQLAVVIVVAVLVPLAWRRGSTPQHEMVAWILTAVVAVRVLPLVWNDWAGFRGLSELHVLGGVAIVSAGLQRRVLGTVAVLMTSVWIVTAVHMSVVV